ncbi:MAG: DUF2721 domain-containing protein [Nevskia sp.]
MPVHGLADNARHRSLSGMTEMVDEPQIASIAHVIQLAVAPVFLLSGIGAILNVLSNRLSRIVDRARQMEAQLPAAAERALGLRASLRNLGKRARLANFAISFCTVCAVLICSDIVVLFVGTLIGFNLAVVVAVVFVLAMLCLITGLIAFLREVYLATRYLRIGEPEPEAAAPAVVVPTDRGG